MIAKLKHMFPVIVSNSCHQSTSDKYFEIIDIEDACCTITKNNGHFSVKNKDGKQIEFLAVDKCVFNTNEHQKCDFILFNNVKFIFVEIKDTYKRTSSKKIDAKKQLETTIKLFKELIDFDGYELQAIISWGYKPKKPAISTQSQNTKIEFWNKYRVEFNEGNFISF